MKYTAIDFETANSTRASACALGIVVSDGVGVAKSWYRLIHPPEMRFDPNCVRVNNILPDMVENEPEFPAFYPEISSFLEGAIVFAHNAAFDVSVLAAMLDYYNLPRPHFQYACTVKLSRALWPDMVNHKLNTVAGNLGFRFQHHQALADAAACAHIVGCALRETGAKDAETLLQICGQPLSPFTDPSKKKTQ